MTDDFQVKMRRYADNMPVEWAKRWDSTSARAYDVLALIEDVVRSVDSGAITDQQAGFVLRPLMVHPVSQAWPDGELTAIGLHADALTAGPQLMSRREAEYEWGEVLQCLKRALSAQLPA